MTYFPPNARVIYTDAGSHETVLTCVCRRSGGAGRSFTLEDLCFPLWLSEVFDGLNRQDVLAFLNTAVCDKHACSDCILPVYEEMLPIVSETIVRSQSLDISPVCLSLSLCLSPSHLTPALNCRTGSICLFHLDTLKLMCRGNEKRKYVLKVNFCRPLQKVQEHVYFLRPKINAISYHIR